MDHALQIRDLDRESVLGDLMDIGLEGLLLIGFEIIPTNRVYRLAVEIPEEFGCGAWAEFGAESLWTEASLEPGRYWTGFHIIDISPKNQARIRCLLDGI